MPPPSVFRSSAIEMLQCCRSGALCEFIHVNCVTCYPCIMPCLGWRFRQSYPKIHFLDLLLFTFGLSIDHSCKHTRCNVLMCFVAVHKLYKWHIMDLSERVHAHYKRSNGVVVHRSSIDAIRILSGAATAGLPIFCYK